MKKIISITYIVIGVSIIGLWTMLLVTNNVPELQTEPTAILFHIIIEIVMALFCILTGLLFVRSINLARPFFFLASGMLFYSIINSAGYYMELKNIPMIMMFLLLFILISTLVFLFLRTKSEPK